MIIKNPETGEDMEVFTSEEVATKETEASSTALEKYKTENPDKSQELDTLKSEKEKLEKDLVDAKKLNAAGEGDGKIAELTKQLEQKDTEMKSYVDQKFTDQHADKAKQSSESKIKELAKGDAEREKKLQYEFENYRSHDTSEKGIEERLVTALTIVDGSAPKPGVFDRLGSLGARGNAHQAKQPDDESDNSKKIGQVFGVTDDDRANVEKFKKGRASGQF